MRTRAYDVIDDRINYVQGSLSHGIRIYYSDTSTWARILLIFHKRIYSQSNHLRLILRHILYIYSQRLQEIAEFD